MKLYRILASLSRDESRFYCYIQVRIEKRIVLSAKKIAKVVSRWWRQADAAEQHHIPRGAHSLSRQQLSSSVLKVLYRLHKSGFEAYLVGGGVRDLLLNRVSKDFDVATNATPDEIRGLFVNSRIIGRRFQIVHVVFHEETIEVSTFRAAEQQDDKPQSKIQFENTFGCLEEDVWRRDFTVNALYYNISDFSILDYAGGMADLAQKKVKMIGDPILRFKEDPVRLLRAIRFVAKLNFNMEKKTEEGVNTLSELLRQVPGSRLLHEFEKMFLSGYAAVTFKALESYDYLKLLFPELPAILVKKNKAARKLLNFGLENTDKRYSQQLSLSAGFFLSVMLWPVFVARLHDEEDQYSHFYSALHGSIQQTIQQQQAILSIPKRHSAMMRSVWVLQFNLERRRPKRVKSLLRHRYFRAAMDLLELRAKVDKELLSLARWWRTLEDSDAESVADLISALHGSNDRNKK